jgi:hypothetical protein
VGFVSVVESIHHFTLMVGVLRVTQSQGNANEFGLLRIIQQRHFLFKLL